MPQGQHSSGHGTSKDSQEIYRSSQTQMASAQPFVSQQGFTMTVQPKKFVTSSTSFIQSQGQQIQRQVIQQQQLPPHQLPPQLIQQSSFSQQQAQLSSQIQGSRPGPAKVSINFGNNSQPGFPNRNVGPWNPQVPQPAGTRPSGYNLTHIGYV